MILLLAVIAGGLAGLLRAWYTGRPLTPPPLHRLWLVPLAFAPQWLAFFGGAPHGLVSDALAALALVGSQALLLCFAWVNRAQASVRLLGLGLALNLLVIVLNGGLMPISPETVAQLAPDAPPGSWEIGARLGSSKDIVLAADATRLAWLSDRFLWRAWFPFPERVAFSLGDVLIAGGAFGLLWALGAKQTTRQEADTRRLLWA